MIFQFKKLLLLFLITFCLLKSFAQDYSTVHPSSNIGWNLAEVKQNNDLFTGKTGITIPINELNAGRIKIPIKLSYFNKAIQVDQLPSWVGLGWNLQAGGEISRVVNGKPDELLQTKGFTLNFIDIINLIPINSGSIHSQIGTTNNYSYLDNYQYLNNTAWNTNAGNYLSTTLNNLPNVEVLPNVTTYFDHDNSFAWTVQNYSFDYRYYDLEPDEFDFSVDGINGKFYMNHLGNWVCESIAGNFSVTPLIANNVSKSGIQILRMIYGFILTGPDGTKYTFGGTTTNKLENVEFSRGPTGGGHYDNIFELYGTSFLDVCPSAWHLTKIEAPEGDFANLEYEKGGSQITYADAPFGKGNSTGFIRQSPGSLQMSLSEPWYLKKITTSTGYTAEFNSQNSTQLGTNVPLNDPGGNQRYTSFLPYPDLMGEVATQNNSMRKLNSIIIKDGTETIKKFQFDYIENILERLKLSGFKEVSPSTSVVNSKYSFVYNTNLLPNYASGKVDHFGYFNNKRFFADNTEVLFGLSRQDFETQYYSSREPDFAYSHNEVLEKMNLPTGGYREYIYQPNDYSGAVTQWPFSVSPAGSNKETGGIRIWKIKDYLEAGALATETEFIYKKGITSTESSGILAVPEIKYTADKPTNEYFFQTRSFIPFDRLQSNITYTTVFEKSSNGAYKKYDFYNYDNGANDIAPDFETPSPAFFDKATFTNNTFKRGLLKMQTMFTNTGVEVSKTEFKYQDQYDDYSRHARSIRLINDNPVFGSVMHAAAYKQFYFPNILRYEKRQELLNGTYLTSETNNTYDSYNNLIGESKTNSKGELVKTDYKYPYNFNSTDPNNPYFKLTDKHIYNPVIEQRKLVVKNGQDYITEGKIGEFGLFNNLLLQKTGYSIKQNAPVLASSVTATQFNSSTGVLDKDSKYTLDVSLNKYDSKGRLLEQQNVNNVKEVFLYGYHSQYIVAKIVNSAYDIVKTYITQSTLDAPVNDVQLRMHLNQLRTIPNAEVTTYTYKPKVGMTSETDPRGRTTYYRYDDFGRLILILDNDANVIKKYCYNYAGQTVDCNISSFGNTLYTAFLFRNNCPPNKLATPVHITVPANQFHSWLNQEHANYLAAQYAQQQANLQARCIEPIYGRLEYVPVRVDGYNNPDETYNNQFVEVWIKFYSDAACTQPFTLVNNLSVTYSHSNTMYYPTSYVTTPGTETVTALTGTNGIQLSEEVSLFGEWRLLDENGNETYFERWNDNFGIDLVTSDCGEGGYNYNGIILPSWY